MPSAPSHYVYPQHIYEARVLGFVDGDTFEAEVIAPSSLPFSRPAQFRTKVRLIGVDAPEIAREDRPPEPWADAAAAYTQSLLRGSDNRVRLELDAQVEDDTPARRLLAYVWLADGSLLNERLLEQGLAELWTFPPNVKHFDRLHQAELRARANCVGIWSDPSRTSRHDAFRAALPGLANEPLSRLVFRVDEGGHLPPYGDDLPKEKLPHRSAPREDACRIGDVVLRIPPEQIQVQTSAEVDASYGVRSPHPVLTSSGYGQIEVRLTVNFEGLSDINGIPVNGPFGTYYLDGLRPLIAQFLRMPFVPVENAYLNEVWNIHALALSSFIVRTNPDFPHLLTAELVAYPWSPAAFMMVDDAAFGSYFIWPLFRWHYQRLLASNVPGLRKLEPMRGDGSFHLAVLDGQWLAGLEEDRTRYHEVTEERWVNIELADTHLVSASAGLLHQLAPLRMQGSRFPAYQYLGSMDTQFFLELETTREEDVRKLRELFETTQEYLRRFRFVHFGGHVRLDSDLTRLFGARHLLIDAMRVDTVPNFPHLYHITINARSFSPYQSEQELLHGFTGVPAIFDLNSVNRANFAVADVLAEAAVDAMELYPDLGLPRYHELRTVIERIQRFRKARGLAPIRLRHPILDQDPKQNPDIEMRFAEPDFFIAYDPALSWEKTTQDLSSLQLEETLPDAPTSAPRNAFQTFVVDVREDGTFVVGPLSNLTSVRLIGVRWLGEEGDRDRPSSRALAYLRETLPRGTLVRLETDEKREDTDRKLLAYVWLNERTQLNQELVRLGWARADYQPPNVRYTKALLRLQRQAAASGIGEWAHPGEAIRTLKTQASQSAEAQIIPVPDLDDAARPRMVRAGESFMSMDEREIVQLMWHDSAHYDVRGRLARAFPTYVLLFVDEGVFVDGRRLWDNYFASHALVDLQVTEERLNPVAVCTIRLHDIYGAVSTPVRRKFVDQSFWERLFPSITPEMIETRKALLSLRSLTVGAGARVHVRLGYGSIGSKLPVVFNGTVVSVERGPEVVLVAESDGRELVSPIPEWTQPSARWIRNTNTPFLGLGVEPQDFLINLISEREFWLFSLTNRWGKESPLGINHFGVVTKDQPIPGLPVGWQNEDEIGKNIYPAQYPPDELERLGAPLQNAKPLPPPDALAARSLLSNIFGNEPNIQILLYRKSPWDVGQTLALAVPDYVFAVVPHQFRSTVFYGLPYWPVRYGFAYDEAHQLMERYRAFSQFHVYGTDLDIITDALRVSASRIATVCYAKYMRGNGEAVLDVWADRSIRPDFQRPIHIDTSFVQDFGSIRAPILNMTVDLVPDVAVTGFIQPLVDLVTGKVGSLEFAYRHALWAARATLREAMGRMYTGQVAIVGDPTLRVHDVAFLNDTHQMIQGPVGMQRVTHVLSSDSGFITLFEPRLVATLVGSGWGGWAYRAILAGPLLAARLVLRYLVSLSRSATRIATGAATRVGVSGPAARAVLTRSAEMATRLGGRLVSRTALAPLLRAASTAASRLGSLSSMAGGVLAPVGVTLLLSALVDFAARKLVHEFISSERPIMLWPVYFRGVPYVAGIDGQKHLIPGWSDVRLSEALVEAGAGEPGE